MIDDEEAPADPENEEGKPDPNSDRGRPDPNAYYPSPDDPNGGGPNSLSSVSAFPTSRDYYPAPDGDGAVGPHAADAKLASVPIALGRGMQSTIRQIGAKSGRIVR